MGWTAISDQVPNQGQKVIVFNGSEVLSGEYWIHEDGVHDADTGFCDINQDDIFPVTHWMSFPEPPK